MARVTTLLLLTLTGICSATFCERAATGQDTSSQYPILLVVHQESELQDETRARASAKSLRSGTALIGLRPQAIGDPARPGWRVVTLDEPPRHGWVRAGVVSTIGTRTKELKATAIALRATGFEKRQSLPELILAQNNPAIQQAWREVSVAIFENDALLEDERLPEPYFARAEIWASVKNYSDSLRDYLTAIKYARKSNSNILSYSEYFDKLYDVAEKLQNIPVPAAGAESEMFFAAQRHYGHGISKFFTGDLREALDRFDSTVQLAPDQPVYWYFRALTHKRLGDEQRAQHDALMGASFERQYDALMGASFERQFGPWRQRALNDSLTRVQGPMRIWLESYRLGSPTNSLLRQYEVRVSTAGGIR
jgi:hypothetical protein